MEHFRSEIIQFHCCSIVRHVVHMEQVWINAEFEPGNLVLAVVMKTAPSLQTNTVSSSFQSTPPMKRHFLPLSLGSVCLSVSSFPSFGSLIKFHFFLCRSTTMRRAIFIFFSCMHNCLLILLLVSSSLLSQFHFLVFILSRISLTPSVSF